LDFLLWSLLDFFTGRLLRSIGENGAEIGEGGRFGSDDCFRRRFRRRGSRSGDDRSFGGSQ
jgi:hypothetical protein